MYVLTSENGVLPGGCKEPVRCMKAREADKDVARASQPGPKSATAATPNAAHPICATNMLYFCTYITCHHKDMF